MTAWLRQRWHVIAPDAPADISPAAHMAAAASAIEQLALGPAVVVGQSLGGLTAIRLAAARPDLVRALVVAEASPAPADDPDAAGAEVAASLRRWPVPFPSRDEAVAFFGGPSLRAEAWADGLERRDDGWWPRFDVDVMARTLREAVAESAWDAWERVSCPALVVRAGEGALSAADAQAMVDRGHDVRLAELPGAGHDLHLDQPDEWRRIVGEFVASLDF